jgi:hypothetical protein
MTITIHTKGFLFPGRANFSDPADYTDFVDRTFTSLDFRPMLDNGVLPLGLIIQAEEGGILGPLGVVVVDPLGGQKVERLER